METSRTRKIVRIVNLILISLTLLICAGIVILILGRDKGDIPEPVVSEDRNGVALIITGAAARIPQEAALLEELDRRGLLEDLVFISGVSAGALNAVLINGILSKRISWDEYKSILFRLENDDIFIKNKKKLPFDTSPARELYKSVTEEKLKFNNIGDLPYTTAISITYPKHLDLQGKVYRMCSRKINEETDTTLSLVDIMMATSAFPLAFPPVRIENVTTIPDVEYIDGAASEDIIPYYALLEFEKHRGKGVEKVYIISYKNDSIPEVSDELRGLGIDDRGIFNRLGISLDALLSKGIRKRLEDFAVDAPEMMDRTYIWIPEFKGNFLLLNFSNLKNQYDLTSQWAKTHEPVPLIDYLEKLRIEDKKIFERDSLERLHILNLKMSPGVKTDRKNHN